MLAKLQLEKFDLGGHTQTKDDHISSDDDGCAINVLAPAFSCFLRTYCAVGVFGGGSRKAHKWMFERI